MQKMISKTSKYLLVLITVLVLISCATEKRYANYKEGVATITSYGQQSGSNPLLVTLVTGETQSHSHITWTNYSFTIRKKITEYDPDDTTCYNFKIHGKDVASSHSEIGDKFVVKYDPKEYDNFHNFLVLCKPLFLPDEKTITTKGKIVVTYGKDRLRNGMIAVRFQYNIPVLNRTGDTTLTPYMKYQYLVPKLNIDSIKADIKANREFKVLYSVENPKRAILYYSQ